MIQPAKSNPLGVFHEKGGAIIMSKSDNEAFAFGSFDAVLELAHFHRIALLLV